MKKQFGSELWTNLHIVSQANAHIGLVSSQGAYHWEISKNSVSKEKPGFPNSPPQELYMTNSISYTQNRLMLR